MIYQDAKRFLRTAIKTPNINIDFNSFHEDFLSYMLERTYTFDDLIAQKSELKIAFNDFFGKVARAAIFFKDQKIILKLLPYNVAPENSRHLSRLIELTKLHNESITRENNLYKIKGKLRREINAEIADSNEEVNKNDVIKLALKQALNLEDSIVVVFLKRSIIIREISEHVEKEEAESKLSNDELQTIYTELVEKYALEEILNSLMSDLLKEELNCSQISNEYFHKTSLNFIKMALVSELSKTLEYKDEQIIDIANFVMKKEITNIFTIISKYLLRELYKKNENVKKFIEYYNGEILVYKGKRFKIPTIESTDGRRWNAMTMGVVVTPWFANIDKNAKAKKEIGSALEEMKVFEDELKKYSQQIIDYTNKIAELTEDFNTLEKDLSNTIYKLNHLKNDKADESTIAKFTTIYDELKTKKTKVDNELIDTNKNLHEVSYTKNKLAKEYNTFGTRAKELSKLINYTENQANAHKTNFDLITAAITKTLLTKKVEI